MLEKTKNPAPHKRKKYDFVLSILINQIININKSNQSRSERSESKSWAGQIGHTVANGSPRPQYFFERSSAASRGNEKKMGLSNSLHSSA